MRYPLLCLLALLTHLGAETLPPLKDGQVPQNLDALWGDFDPAKEPLVAEVTKEWEQDGIVCRVIRYRVGIFKGQPATVAAFYAFPKGATALPGLMHIHGGGQSANLATAVTDAKRGYASLSLNWGGNKMTFADGKIYDGLNTDWGALDATHPPQRNKVNHFAGGTKPDTFTLDAVESPRNDNWFLVTLAARRGLTFLQSQPQVDPARLGVYGHSMGGRLTTQLTGIDKRVKAAVPSCGGSGDLTATLDEMPGGERSKAAPLALATTSENPYIARLSVPTLWFSPTNDFHAHMDNMAWTWRGVPDQLLRLSMSPHFNHRHDHASTLTQHLWFETHLKGKLGLIPTTPAIAIEAGRIPKVIVTPDASKPCQTVRIYVSQDVHELTRFWRRLEAKQADGRWIAEAPLMDPKQPLFAYANVVYATPEEYRKIPTVPGVTNSDTYYFSSREAWMTPAKLKAAGAQATDQPERLLTADSADWGDWYRINWGNPELWSVHTRKVKDPKWRGPKGAKLRFEIKARENSWLAVKFASNEWGAFAAGPKAEYAVVKELKVTDGWAEVEVELTELRPIGATKGKLADWSTLTEISLSPSIPAELKTPEMKPAKGWTRGTDPAIRNLRWEGGNYDATQQAPATLTEAERTKAFNDAIKASLEQEKKDKASR
ncbi:MAG: acetylxylan esterase [Opitutales bacterium]|nr:acetylxylan esterase [Opitutales bacterium]